MVQVNKETNKRSMSDLTSGFSLSDQITPRVHLSKGAKKRGRLNSHNCAFIQVNLRHCKAAMALLSKRNCGDTFVGLIQEPYAYKGKVTGLSRKGKVFAIEGDPNPRACIITSTNVETW